MNNVKFIVSIFVAILLFSCQKDEEEVVVTEEETETVEETYEDTDFTADDWTIETHSKDGDPNFTEVFDDTEVKRLDIVLTSARWQAMLDNMTDLYGTFGSSSGGPGGGLVDVENPDFVPAEIFCNGKEWYRVGVRFKGNSSLQSTWRAGNLKLSFKLDFDEFEDQYPQIDNQRFHGFKKLSLKNNYDDKSFVREKISADVFKKAGLAVSHTAFYTLFVDYGDGPVYFGLYTLVEEVDNTVIKTQYSNDDGNLYKPDGTGASFAVGTFDQDEFEKKTNEDDSDWSDIESVFSILHDNSRTENPELWRENLNSVFNTDVFLKYLAVNTIVQNWDTYGKMTHNYYLYNNPDNNKLEWIPWDNNEALQDGKMGGSLALDFANLEANAWPMIEYLYKDEHYKAKYDAYLEEVITTAFEPVYVKSLYSNYAALIQEYATNEQQGYTFLNGAGDFSQAISTLNVHADSRKTAVEEYLK
jgi:spore coat protein CotH